jgi:two-component system cell cycle sensor histidine kinase PleC
MHQETFGPGIAEICRLCSDIRQSGQYLLGVISDALDMSTRTGRVRLQKTDFEIDAAVGAAVAAVATIATEKEICLLAKPAGHVIC